MSVLERNRGVLVQPFALHMCFPSAVNGLQLRPGQCVQTRTQPGEAGTALPGDLWAQDVFTQSRTLVA